MLDFWFEDDFFGLIATPSISPEFGNNPGFSTFEVNGDKVQNLEFTFLNLTSTFGENPRIQFMKVWAEKDLGIKEISPKGFKKFYEML